MAYRVIGHKPGSDDGTRKASRKTVDSGLSKEKAAKAADAARATYPTVDVEDEATGKVVESYPQTKAKEK